MTKLLCIPSIVFVVAALLVGCGGSDESTLSTAELTQQADVICWKAHNESFKGISEYTVKHAKELTSLDPQVATGRAIVVATVPALQTGISELEDLAVSDKDEEKVDKFTAALNEAIKATEEDPSSNAATSGVLYRDASKLAREYNFGRCENLP
jgi:hypothetical protein